MLQFFLRIFLYYKLWQISHNKYDIINIIYIYFGSIIAINNAGFVLFVNSYYSFKYLIKKND